LKESYAILDLGTSKITVMIGSRGANNSICIDGIGICDYAGFTDGEWLAPDKLGAAVEQAVATAESSARLKINKLYIGVPGDFLLCKVNDVMMSLGKKRRVLDRDVDALHSQGNEYFDDPEWSVVNIQPIYYVLDDERKLIAPVGLTSTRLGGSISYILARKSFISLIDAAVAGAGIAETEYVSSPLAEVLFLFDDYKRDNCVMLADIGALGTTLAIARGDGICRQYYFSWGGDRITAALCEALDIEPEAASALKRKVVLTLSPDYIPPRDDPGGIIQTEYTVVVDNEPIEFDVAEVNAAVKAEIQTLGRYIEKAFKLCDYDYPDFTALSVTGGGLDIRGACGYLSDCIGRDVELLKPRLPLLDKPRLSSALGLMDMVLSSGSPYSGVAGKFRRLFGKRR
jgi:cell division protein FtsA